MTADEINAMDKDALIEKLAEVREFKVSVDENTVDYTSGMMNLSETTGTGSFFNNDYVFKLIMRFTDTPIPDSTRAKTTHRIFCTAFTTAKTT